MSRRLSDFGQATALVFIGLMVLAIPAGLALAQGLTASPTVTESNTVVTPTLPLVNLTETPTPTDSEGSPPKSDGNTLVVDENSGTGGDSAKAVCPDAEYQSIQRAVDDASQGATVVVCGAEYEPPTSIEIERANLTLRAYGEVVIKTVGQPAVRTTAPRVTIRGFTVRTTQAEYSIAVGGRKSLIQNNTVEVTGNSTAIFLSDGLTSEGVSDPMLGAATESQVVNNTVNGSENTFSQGVFTDADQTIIRDNTFFAEDNTNSIRSAGNKTVIQANTIRNLNPCRQEAFNRNDCNAYNYPPAILIGKYNPEAYTLTTGSLCSGSGDDSTHDTHNWARRNRIMKNSVADTPGVGLHIMGTGTHSEIMSAVKGVVVQNNNLSNTGGIAGWSNQAVYRNNTVDADNFLNGESTSFEGGNENAICLHAHNTRIIGNTLDGYTAPNLLLTGGRNITVKRNHINYGNPGLRVTMHSHWDGPREEVKSIRIINNTVINGSRTFSGVILFENISEFAHNTVINSTKAGVEISRGATVSEFHHNTITGNAESGVVISSDATVTGLHHNLIDNNGRLGIHKENQNIADGEWPIVNATHNFWGCGGPSSGLRDPYTNRTANGSGDPISAGDEAGMSNINFDPFFVREDVDCPAAMSNPTPPPTATPTPTPTATSTPTLTATSTPTPTPMSGTGSRNGTGGGDGNGTGGTGNGTGGTGGADGPSESGTDGTTTPPPTPTATVTQTPPTPTISPTPVVEPGFGVLTWLVGVILLGGLMAFRRQMTRRDTHD